MNNSLLRSLLSAVLLSLCIGKGFAEPVGLTATAVSSSQINLSWGESGTTGCPMGGYSVQRWIPGVGFGQIGTVDSCEGGTFSDTGLSPSTTYTYLIYAWYWWGGDAINGYSGNAIATTWQAVPAAPSSLSGSAVSATQINLNWTDNSSNEAGFKIERKAGAGGTYAEIATVGANSTAYVNAGLSTDTAYYYRVRAYNGGGVSAYTNELQTATLPTAPSGVSTTSISATQINLNWTDASNSETGFKIERKTGVNGTYSEITLTAANATTFSDTGLNPTTSYYYRVRAANSGGDSAFSNEVLGTTLTPPSAPPTALSAAPLGSNQITLTWTDASSNETAFKVERKTGSGGTYSQISTTTPNATSYSDSGLVANTTYYYRVRATNSGGDSTYSNEALATTGPVANVTNGVVEYTYDAYGNLIQTNAGGVITVLTYDQRGRKIAMSDPDMGNWSYTYNALGELVSQTDAKLQTATMEYDLLGRMTQRTEADLISTWTYDTCTKGIGKLCQASADNGYQRTHAYDSLGRSSLVTTTIDTSYTVTMGYDSSSRVQTVTYPDGFAVKNVYNTYGYLAEVRNNADNSLFWQAQTLSASGRVIQELLGNGLTATRAYDVVDRLIAQTASGTGGTAQSNTYAYDALGNLTQRSDVAQGVSEYFYYDTLNRLLASSGPGLVSRSYEYDAIGNITYKSDVGSYTYGTKPHAVASVSGTVNATYQYDANGNLTSGAGRTLAYTTFNLPRTMAQGTDSFVYTYNAEHERARLTVTRASGTYTTIYLHPGGSGSLLYEKETFPDGKIEYRHYVAAIGVYVTKSTYAAGDGPGMRYFHRDHLGSLQVITNDSGAVIERFAYEAFGKRRFPNGTADPGNALIGVTTERGFTGHEHLDELQLIHMNGRIFDPLLGRFMTADPTIQFPANLQSYNRYSYAINNPFVYTDPSGFNLFSRATNNLSGILGNIGGSTAGAAFAFFGEDGRLPIAIGSAYVVGSSPCGAFCAGFVFAFIMSDGNVKEGIKGGVTAYFFSQAGSYFDAYESEYYSDAVFERGANPTYGRIAAHAAIGAFDASMNGGNVFAGGIAQGFSKFATMGLDGLDIYSKGVAVTIVGGVTAELGGGKFANGARTAAFGYLFNEIAHRTCMSPTVECAAQLRQEREAARREAIEPSFGPDDLILGVISLPVSGVRFVGSLAFRSGGLFEGTFLTSRGAVDILAETVVSGNALVLKDAVLYGRGSVPLTGMRGDIYQGLGILQDAARAQGFSTLQITGTRVPGSTSAVPGRNINWTFDLSK